MRILRLFSICFLLMSVCVACDSFNLFNTFILPSNFADKRFETSQKINQTHSQTIISSPFDKFQGDNGTVNFIKLTVDKSINYTFSNY